MASSVISSNSAQTSYRVADTLSQAHIQQLHALYQNESWSKGRSLEETASCIQDSSLYIALLGAHDNLVAFARVLSDYIFKAIIFDVIVQEQCRGDGLGDVLIELIKNHPRLSRVKHFELYCVPELHPFYARHGFTTDVSNMSLMRYINHDRKI